MVSPGCQGKVASGWRNSYEIYIIYGSDVCGYLPQENWCILTSCWFFAETFSFVCARERINERERDKEKRKIA